MIFLIAILSALGLFLNQKNDENPVFTFGKGMTKGLINCLVVLVGFLMLLSLLK